MKINVLLYYFGQKRIRKEVVDLNRNASGRRSPKSNCTCCRPTFCWTRIRTAKIWSASPIWPACRNESPKFGSRTWGRATRNTSAPIPHPTTTTTTPTPPTTTTASTKPADDVTLPVSSPFLYTRKAEERKTFVRSAVYIGVCWPIEWIPLRRRRRRTYWRVRLLSRVQHTPCTCKLNDRRKAREGVVHSSGDHRIDRSRLGDNQ